MPRASAKKRRQAPPANVLAGLSPIALMLLDAGARHPHGRPNQLRREDDLYARELEELRERGLMRWVGIDPMITEEGRDAVGADPQLGDARWSEWNAERIRAKNATKPVERVSVTRLASEDPITDMNYRILRTMKMAAVVFVRMSPDLTANGKVFASRDGSLSKKFYFDPGKMIEQPETRDNLVLALLSRGTCRWITDTFAGTNMFGCTQPLVGDQWTERDLKTWASLDRRAGSINVRIANGGNRTHQRGQYGATA